MIKHYRLRAFIYLIHFRELFQTQEEELEWLKIITTLVKQSLI